MYAKPHNHYRSPSHGCVLMGLTKYIPLHNTYIYYILLITVACIIYTRAECNQLITAYRDHDFLKKTR